MNEFFSSFSSYLNGAGLANHLWMWTRKGGYERFVEYSHDPARVQDEILRYYIRNNEKTDFGKRYNFFRIHNRDDYRRLVPLQEWSDIEERVRRIAQGEEEVLTRESVLFLERTSGTTRGAKYVPYTSRLKTELECGLAPWLYSLYQDSPEIFAGAAYWSLSPPLQDENTEDEQDFATRLRGTHRDQDYFNPLSAALLSQIMAVPDSLSREKDPDRFFLLTLARLLSREDLSLISVWSPTFFMRLDDFLRQNRDRLREILMGKSELKFGGVSSSRRKFLLGRLSGDFTWEELWPGLKLMSCWTHAQSSFWIPGVRERLGDIRIQPKGLMSTEGMVSFPLERTLDPVLSIQSHFFEFRRTGDEEIFFCDELELDEEYEVIMSTGGGLYRYLTGDIVRVTGFYNKTPCFEFIGRRNTSDLVGEKLAEFQVYAVLREVFGAAEKSDLRLGFLYPHKNEAGNFYYCLYLIPRDERGQERLEAFLYPGGLEKFEAGLRKNPYYHQALELGQLAPLRAKILPSEMEAALRHRIAGDSKSGEGNVKAPVLFRENRLEGLLPDDA